MSVFGRAWLLLPALAAGVVLAGCGGGGVASLDPVAQAASKSAADQSFRFTFRADGKVAGDGAYDAAAKRLRMSFDVPFGQGAPMPLELVTDTSQSVVVYARFPFLSALLPQGKAWVKVDLRRAAKAKGLDLGQLLQAGQSSPAELLAALVHSQGSKKLGTESVGGVETTHYRVTLDPRDSLLRNVHGEVRQKLERALEEAKLRDLPVDVWVGDDGLVRRLQVELPRVPGVQGGTFTEDLTGYGEPVHVELPAAGQVVDASDGKLHP
jgi:hypothetical protein